MADLTLVEIALVVRGGDRGRDGNGRDDVAKAALAALPGTARGACSECGWGSGFLLVAGRFGRQHQPLVCISCGSLHIKFPTLTQSCFLALCSFNNLCLAWSLYTHSPSLRTHIDPAHDYQSLRHCQPPIIDINNISLSAISTRTGRQPGLYRLKYNPLGIPQNSHV
ncbi:hypothetical protein K461DRAFT_27895 [Myriangium duriaei CBS 260.36]|uniref:Uncharacterized protein n=1 Tax=Myriangium duriaei CBS 260.36 TaxID=1168546 RepID=A0A9P4JFD8_9PEZI|nr:hypothetical protein K461DRAFT_27895 [Myriangium duriaei CBS 260.36]